MSSYLLKIDYEAQRKAKIKKELEKKIKKLKDKIRVVNSDSVEFANCSNYEMELILNDDGETGYEIDESYSGKDKPVGGVQRDVFEFSDFLIKEKNRKTKIENEIEETIKSAKKRFILDEQDYEARLSLDNHIKMILENDAIDEEDKLGLIKMSVDAFLDTGVGIDEIDYEKIIETYKEYLALCALSGIAPKKLHPFEVESEAERIKSLLNSKEQEEELVKTVKEILELKGCNIIGDAIFNETEGILFATKEAPGFAVFVGEDNGSLMFEPILDTEDETKNNSVIQADVIQLCDLSKDIIEELSKKGIVVKNKSQKEVNNKNIKNKRNVKNSVRRKKKQSKEKVLRMEV